MECLAADGAVLTDLIKLPLYSCAAEDRRLQYLLIGQVNATVLGLMLSCLRFDCAKFMNLSNDILQQVALDGSSQMVLDW
jgi:hypothetical protein